jgi:bifunctional DNA-binding transcriptional regulator/antitoxin component of YhaV-PrlF toxin-antitoxin module
MENRPKKDLLAKLDGSFGGIRKLERTKSLYEFGANRWRIYIRYSRVHHGWRTFYGLRREDLQQLEGHRAFICFLWDGQKEPLILPFEEYEEVFRETTPASDGQYKVQVYLRDEGTEFYIARAGRFNVDAHIGWSGIENADQARKIETPALSHSQVQTLLGAIGSSKDFDIWIPRKDREALDWKIADRFSFLDKLPKGYEAAQFILEEIDTLWVQRGSNQLSALYEVEHSTPIYSGLLRFNDVRLMSPNVERFAVVSNETRRSLFIKQLQRPTFQRSGLSEHCSFLEYADVYEWHSRIRK